GSGGTHREHNQPATGPGPPRRPRGPAPAAGAGPLCPAVVCGADVVRDQGNERYNKLFEERIIFLGVQIDDASANDVIAQLIALESMDPDRDITMYINSPGGSVTSMMAIYDTMQFVQPEIQTVCIGQAASAAAGLLAA